MKKNYKTVIVFNGTYTDCDSVFNDYTKQLEYAHANFKESLGESNNADERRTAAGEYLDDILHLKVKYSNFSRSIDKETTMITKSLCEIYEFNKDEVSKLYDYHLKNDKRAVSIYTIKEPEKAISKDHALELSLSRE